MTDDVTRDVRATALGSKEPDGDAPWRFSLRGTQADRAIVERVVKAHQSMGLNISLNDAVLVLIRRAATPDADTQEEARAALEQHWAQCPHGCKLEVWPPKCPEGWRLRDAYTRVRDRRPEPLPRPSPTPPPPAAAPPGGLRGYLGFRKAG